MSNFFKSLFQSLFETVRDWREDSYYKRMFQEAPLQIKQVKLAIRDPNPWSGCANRSVMIKNFFFYRPTCPDSAGYLSLCEDGGKLKLTGICETDFTGPRLRDAVFINGKRLRPFAAGECAELNIPRDARIEYFTHEYVPRFWCPYWVTRRVRVMPILAA